MPRSDATQTLRDLYRRPGFMIRRAHQMAVAIFLDECRASRLTTTQYGVLLILQRRPAIDQNTLARLLGLDRSTTGLVVRKLAERGLVTRPVRSRDLRQFSASPGSKQPKNGRAFGPGANALRWRTDERTGIARRIAMRSGSICRRWRGALVQ